MGCLQAKGKGEDHQVQAEKDPPKTYSWDKREKVDPAEFTIENISGQEVGRLPGKIDGQQFIIQNCQSSQIYLFDHLNTITVDDCSDCIIFIGPTTGSLFLRDCHDCVVVAACGQFRTRDCCKMDVFLLCQTQPIIEASTKMRFGCFQAYYPQLADHFTKSKISVFNNNWANIHDFTPVEGETNWSSITQNSSLEEAFKFPESAAFKSVGLTVDPNLSVVPYTLGSPVYGTQEAALIIFFYDEAFRQRAINFITLLKTEVVNCVVQHTREVKMEIPDAQRVFRTSEYNSAISQGPVIALLCLGTGVMAASSSIAKQVNSSSSVQTVFVTSDSTSSTQQIDSFFSYASMSMAL